MCWVCWVLFDVYCVCVCRVSCGMPCCALARCAVLGSPSLSYLGWPGFVLYRDLRNDMRNGIPEEARKNRHKNRDSNPRHNKHSTHSRARARPRTLALVRVSSLFYNQFNLSSVHCPYTSSHNHTDTYSAAQTHLFTCLLLASVVWCNTV